MNIKQYLDSTYLKTAQQARLSEKENLKVVKSVIQEAIDENFKLIMIRPEMVSLAHKMILKSNSKVSVGTVISFPEGTNSLDEKLDEAHKAILDGADELDFVCNYQAFKNGDVALVKKEILEGTRLAFEHNKKIKWIIEVAALNDTQIIQICTLIKNTIIANFKDESFNFVFVKSSTGFYKAKSDLPNGATISAIIIMLENASPLQIKAAGGVKNLAQAMVMIQLGVKRIGTSSAKEIANGMDATNKY